MIYRNMQYLKYERDFNLQSMFGIKKSEKKIKPQPRYLYGCKRINCLDKNGISLDSQGIMHQVFPVCSAKVMPLIDKFQILHGDIFFLNSKFQKNNQINPMFKYCMFSQILYDYSRHDFKETGYIKDLKNEQRNSINQTDAAKIKEVEDLISALVDELKKSSDQRIIDLRKSTTTRQEKLRLFTQITNEQFQKCAQECIKLLQRAQVMQKFPQKDQQEAYIKNSFQSVKSIELLKILDQTKKIDLQCKKYKKSFATEIVVQKVNRISSYSVRVSRPSLQSQPVLIKLSDLVELRLEHHNTKAEFIQMMKDLFEQTKNFYLQTASTDRKEFYEFLSPESVIIDQISLRPKLSYQPIIEDMFGLRNKPCSVENKLAFFCTPKQFDYFQSQFELEQNAKTLLNDPFYGNDEMHRKLQRQQKQRVNYEAKRMEAKKQSMFVDRFLLTSHFMVNKKYFGKVSRPISNKHIETEFKKQLIKAKQRIKEQSSYLEKFLGIKVDPKYAFNFKFEDLSDCLTSFEEDSFVNRYKYTSTLRLFNVKYSLIQASIFYLSSAEYFQKIINVKKYITLFLIIAIQYFQELKTYLSLESDRYAEIPQMKLFLENNGKKLKNGKGVQYSIESTYSKFYEYKDKESGSKFLKQDDFGKKIFEFLNELNKQISNQKMAFREIVQQIQNGSVSQSKISNLIKTCVRDLDQSLEKYKSVLLQFVYSQVELRYTKGPHRFTEAKQQPFYEFITKKFCLILYSFVQCSKKEFIKYQTLVLPMLRLDELADEKAKMLEDPTKNPIKQENPTQDYKAVKIDLQQQSRLLFEIDTIIGWTKNRPQKFEFLGSRQDKSKNKPIKTKQQQNKNVKQYDYSLYQNQ